MRKPPYEEDVVIRARVVMNSYYGSELDAGIMLIRFGELLGHKNGGWYDEGEYIENDNVFVKQVTAGDKLPDNTVDFKIILESDEWEYILDFLSSMVKRFNLVDIEEIWTCERYADDEHLAVNKIKIKPAENG